LSTGLIYLPGTFAKTEEIVELAKVAAAYDGVYASHMRDEGDEIFQALDELFRIAREARIRAEVSHIKLSGKPNWGRADKVLAAIESARAEGLDVTQDMYVYTASSTGISQLIPSEAREGGKFKERLADPQEKASIVAAIKERLAKKDRDNFDYAMIADYAGDPSLNGLNIVEAARKARGGDSLDDQVELILEIQANGGASGVFHGMSEDDLQLYLHHPNTMIGADSSVREFEKGVPHPRGYGNTARVLARYVRDLKLLRLEEAIRKMTSLPATTFRLRDRGQIREGAWADLVVFDPDAVQDQATFQEPHRYATGFRWVLVNGKIVVENDAFRGIYPGAILRR
jgi:N-acyl-D-amino-acid deacylase